MPSTSSRSATASSARCTQSTCGAAGWPRRLTRTRYGGDSTATWHRRWRSTVTPASRTCTSRDQRTLSVTRTADERAIRTIHAEPLNALVSVSRMLVLAVPSKVICTSLCAPGLVARCQSSAQRLGMAYQSK